MMSWKILTLTLILVVAIAFTTVIIHLKPYTSRASKLLLNVEIIERPPSNISESFSITVLIRVDKHYVPMYNVETPNNTITLALNIKDILNVLKKCRGSNEIPDKIVLMVRAVKLKIMGFSIVEISRLEVETSTVISKHVTIELSKPIPVYAPT